MERVEARNGAEAYLYNSRNAINEEKVKAALSEEDKSTVEAAVKAGLEWLDENREASKADVDAKQKEWEETIRPVMMRLYASSAGKTDPTAAAGEPAGTGPTVEEVD
jgi:molecular chaperone DnaK (HSP70)